MGLSAGSIGIRRTETKSTLVNLVFNNHLLIFYEIRAARGGACPDDRKSRKYTDITERK